MKRLILIIYLFAFVPIALLGQNEASYWYFGKNAGLQFNPDGSVTSLTDGQLNTFEGCTSIADTSGSLLFYTDGVTVFNRNHEVMENGNNINGDPSSTQSAIIVPRPDFPNQYYIFTVDTMVGAEDVDTGLNYSIVDLSLENGLGAITIKNINLLEDCSEKVSAVLSNCKEQAIWVVTFANEAGVLGAFDTYFAFKVSPDGVADPVKSTFDAIKINDQRGYLKFSPDGTKLVSANYLGGLYLLDFDTETGIVSNPKLLNITASNSNIYSYGIEFSPNQQFLYVHTHNGGAPNDPLAVQSSSLIQIDLNALDIEGSQVELDNRPLYRGALQAGPNGKIYRTLATNYFNGQPFLGVINNPNIKGTAANYQHNAVDLQGRNSTQGLPPFVQSFFNNTAIAIDMDGNPTNNIVLCEGSPIQLQVEDQNAISYTWKKDEVEIGITTASFSKNSATVSDSGLYSVEITYPDADCPVIGSAFVSVNTPPEAPNLNLVQCYDNGTNSGLPSISFNLNESVLETENNYFFYESLLDIPSDQYITNSNQYEIDNTTPKTIYYKVVNQYGCENVGEILLQTQAITDSSMAQENSYQCAIDDTATSTFDLNTFSQNYFSGMEVVYYATFDNAIEEIKPITPEFKTTSTQIYARIETDNDCLDIIPINLNVLPQSTFDFQETFYVCTDNIPLKIAGPDGFDIYRWTLEDNSTTIGSEKNIFITTPGNYSIEAGIIYDFNGQQIECTFTQSFQVLPSNKATIEEVIINDISNNNEIEIVVSGDGDYLYAIDGFNYQTSPIFKDVAAGFVTVYIKDENGCGLTEKEISVIGYPKFFTPNGDGQNDTWRIFGANDKFQPNAIISIFDRYGKLLRQFSAATEGWDGNHLGNPLPASDYWFSVNLEDGRTFKGHFTLKR